MAHEEGQLGLPFGALVGMVATGDELVDLVTVRVRARARARARARCRDPNPVPNPQQAGSSRRATRWAGSVWVATRSTSAT